MHISEQLPWRYRDSRYFRILRLLRQHYGLHLWTLRGRSSSTPVLFKHNLVKQYGDRFAIKTLIETGTARGDMVYAQRNNFDEIESIELDRELFSRAVERFQDHQHITISQGDSGDVLPVVLSGISQPALFWLDGHAMDGGVTGRLLTPIRQELAAILSHHVRDHVLLIDDARLFTGQSDYPTIDELVQQIKIARPEWVFEIKNDIIRAHPSEIGIYTA